MRKFNLILAAMIVGVVGFFAQPTDAANIKITPLGSHDGEFWQFEDMRLQLRSFQQPRLPLAIATAGSPDSLELAGRHGMILMSLAGRNRLQWASSSEIRSLAAAINRDVSESSGLSTIRWTRLPMARSWSSCIVSSRSKSSTVPRSPIRRAPRARS